MSARLQTYLCRGVDFPPKEYAKDMAFKATLKTS